MSDDLHLCFSPTYEQARQRFRAAAAQAGAKLQRIEHPALDLEGQRLSTDLALLGDPQAERLLVIESGTHGVEGYCGSAIQLAVLQEELAQHRAASTAILLVHAINPYGYSRCRRGDEENVDLNRNFVDFADAAAMRNDLFAELAPHLLPPRWDDAALAHAQERLSEINAKYGPDVVSRALRRGQHTHPGNLFYGGRGPNWSHRAVERIAKEHLAHAATIVFLDVHTGLGEYGELQLLSTDAPNSAEFARLRESFGASVRSTVDPSSGAANAAGNIFAGYKRHLPGIRFLGLALEFGTHAQERVQRALRADAWLHLNDHAGLSDSFRAQVREAMLDAFCPSDVSWQERVVQLGLYTCAAALAVLPAIEY